MISPEVDDAKDEDAKDEDVRTWKSCCLTTDRHAIVYFSQLGMSVGVLSFCFFQLIRSDFVCDRSGPYWSAVTLIIGGIMGRTSTRK